MNESKEYLFLKEAGKRIVQSLRANSFFTSGWEQIDNGIGKEYFERLFTNIIKDVYKEYQLNQFNESLTLKQLKKMDNEKIFVVFDDDVCIPALVAYNTGDCSSEDEEDVVYLTNNIGGRSTYEDMSDMGAKFYRFSPKK